MPILQGIYTQKGWISQWQQIGVANYDAYALAGRFLELRQMDGYITLPVEPMTDKTHNYSKQRHERSRVNCMEKSERSSGYDNVGSNVPEYPIHTQHNLGSYGIIPYKFSSKNRIPQNSAVLVYGAKL
ncbi:hypothetical protein H103_08733 [Trichophyton rubrum CBS 288.86]|uniref:Uncharacterized protein n=1 Tax=Trichophyton rubrum CBS 288.86 TaxID=1215330 RepID=A0A022VNV6_TRIRU|nr:hypothetical protein H103_08733 [Trichophyton rubrum CBS 288.86]